MRTTSKIHPVKPERLKDHSLIRMAGPSLVILSQVLSASLIRCFLILLLVPAPVLLPAQTTVIIEPSCIRDIGGYTHVQELFGIMTGSMDSRVKPYLRDANLTGIRNIINWIPNPGTPLLNYKYPSWNNKKSPRFDTKEASYAWFDEFIARDPGLWNGLLGDLNYLDDSYGTVNVCISGNPFLFDGRLERNPEAARNHVDAYIQALKNTRPQGAGSRLKYFQLHNEPEQEKNWAGQFDMNQKLTVASYVRVFNSLYDHILQKHPDVIFTGNCIGHDGAFRLSHNVKPDVDWNVWVRYFVDHVSNPGALEYFNSHAYGVPTLRNLAYTSMTQNYAEKTRGVRPRQVITETGAPETFLNQFVYTADNIFMMLEHPDKYAVRTGFVAAESGNHSFFRIIDGEVVPQAHYWVLAVLKNLRGKNIHFTSDNDALRVFVAAPCDSSLVAGIFNPTWEEQPVTIQTGMSAGEITGITHRKAVWNSVTGNASHAAVDLAVDSVLQIILAPKSIHAVEIQPRDPLTLNQAKRTREYYGSLTNTPVSNPLNVIIDLPFLPQAPAQAFLRVAFDERPGPGFYNIRLNGHEYTCNLGGLPDKVIDTYHKMVGFLELPVEPEHLQLKNQLSLDVLSGYTLLYSSIVLKDFEAGLHEIYFMVYESNDEGVSPLRDAFVRVDPYSSLTGTDGRASIKGLLDGNYSYTLSKKGYLSASGQITLASDTALADTLLHAAYKVTFLLKDAGKGSPLPGSTLSINGTDHTADAEGNVNISDLSYGYYSLLVSESGYEPLVLEDVEIFSDTTLILNMERPHANVSLRILDQSNGEPLYRAVITWGGSIYMSNTSGEASIDDLTPGSWEFSVELDGFFDHTDSVTVRNDTSMVISLTPETAYVRFIISDGSAPMAGATVSLEGSSRSTDGKGLAFFSDRPARKEYVYSVTLEGYLPAFDTVCLETDTTINIILQEYTGIIQSQSSSMKAYPNPAGDRLYIESGLPAAVLSLIATDGRTVRNVTLTRGLYSFDMTDLQEGTYILRFISGDRVSYRKIIKINTCN